MLTQEELDAHRQALVEQFRAEVSAVTETEGARPIPDVLPTSELPAAVLSADPERDDELARLQRLLGMTGQVVAMEEIEKVFEVEAAGEAKKDEAKEEAPADPKDKKKKKG